VLGRRQGWWRGGGGENGPPQQPIALNKTATVASIPSAEATALPSQLNLKPDDRRRIAQAGKEHRVPIGVEVRPPSAKESAPRSGGAGAGESTHLQWPVKPAVKLKIRGTATIRTPKSACIGHFDYFPLRYGVERRRNIRTPCFAVVGGNSGARFPPVSLNNQQTSPPARASGAVFEVCVAERADHARTS